MNLQKTTTTARFIFLASTIAIGGIGLIFLPGINGRESKPNTLDSTSIAYEVDEPQDAWEKLRQSLQTRLEDGQPETAREVMVDLTEFAELYKEHEVGAIALFNHAQIAMALGESDTAHQSLLQARKGARDPEFIAAIEQSLARLAMRPGQVPPKLAATSMAGKPVALDHYKGKVLLIDFWATWCGPCVAELPNVQRAYERFHDDGFEIVSVSLDRSEKALTSFLIRESMPWTHVYNASKPRGSDPATAYGVTTIPFTVLIGRDGRIAATNMRGSQLELAVQSALKAAESTQSSKTLDIGRSRGPDRPGLGVLDQPAPDWNVDQWFNLPDGTKSINVADYRGKVVYLYGFQSWCPGCHEYGFPTLQKLTKRFKGQEDVAFVAVQTTFEGFTTNTPEKALETADRYGLNIPIGHSGSSSKPSQLMRDYHGGGTPWTIIIDRDGIVRFNDFHITPDEGERLINQLRAPRTEP